MGDGLMEISPGEETGREGIACSGKSRGALEGLGPSLHRACGATRGGLQSSSEKKSLCSDADGSERTSRLPGVQGFCEQLVEVIRGFVHLVLFQHSACAFECGVSFSPRNGRREGVRDCGEERDACDFPPCGFGFQRPFHLKARASKLSEGAHGLGCLKEFEGPRSPFGVAVLDMRLPRPVENVFRAEEGEGIRALGGKVVQKEGVAGLPGPLPLLEEVCDFRLHRNGLGGSEPDGLHENQDTQEGHNPRLETGHGRPRQDKR